MSYSQVMSHPPDPDEARASGVRRANRRRLTTFLTVFVAVSVGGLLWCFLRPAEYRATSRLEITPASASLPAESPAQTGGEADRPFLTEVQTLTSRPLLEQAAERLRSAGHDLSHLGVDPVLGLQATLTATAVTGTHVVEMAAVGPRPELPAALLIGIGEGYRTLIARRYTDTASEATARATEEASRLEAAVAVKRRETEAFRVRHNIVSPEREENSILAEMQGLATTLKEAHKRVAETEGKRNALRASAAEGKGVVRARDNPTLASLELRVSQTRETLREMQRQYTPEYLALDPPARNLRSRLAELEDQLKAQREVGTSNALIEAEEELAGARASVAQLQGQIADGRRRVGEFAARFGQYRSLGDELKELEKTYQAAQQRKARLDATERARMPALQVLEQAALPTGPWRPLYWRDAALVLGGSLLLALAAMALVELFNRREPPPSVVVTQPVFTAALAHPRQLATGLAATRPQDLPFNETPLLTQGHALPRELTMDESTAMMRAADPDTRRALALLLFGLTPQEAITLRWQDLDPANGVLRIGGSAGRTLPLPASAAGLFEAADAELPVLPGPSNGAATLDSLTAQLLCVAHDAGLDGVSDVSPAAVRHSYIVFLVRQGARFADLTRWVGPIDAELLSAYSMLAPTGARLDGGAIRRVHPALERIESA
jgi:polysaccharide biosynthesis transport protein